MRERADIQRALSEHRSLFVAEPDCDQTPVFSEVAASLDKQFDFTENQP